MTESDHDREMGTCLISSECLEAIRSGDTTEKETAHRLIRLKCRRALRGTFRGHLTADEVEDVISNAIAETLPCLLDRSAPASEVTRELARALERHKKRSKRERNREHLRVVQSDVEPLSSHEENFASREQLLDLERVVAHIEGILEEVLTSLRDRDQRLLIEDYGLGPLFKEPRRPSPTFPTDEARRQALSRSRKRFNEALENRLQRALRGAKGDREVLEAALSIVRGGALPSALEMVAG